MERKPRAFGDQRGWLDALRAEGELKEVTAEVDWNIELGTIMRLAQGTGDGPALLFSNIKDYNAKSARCSQVFGCSLSSYRRVAMLLGLPPDTHPRELVKVARTILSGAIPPKIVKDGPVKENIITGDDVDLFEFPTPHWNRLDGGRYMMTYAGCVTKHPDTNVMNVGVYRGMVADKNHIPIYMYRAQHIGHHALAWQQKGAKEMPIAYVIGWEPTLDFCAGSPVPMGVCEYDVMGAIRGVTDVWGPPVHGTMNLNVQIKQTYRNQAKQVANAIWGSSAAHVRYKHVTVVDDDIDIHDYAAVDWAIAYRVNAGENDVIIMPSTFGAGLDPSTRKRDRDIALFGSGKWNRMLIDATINLDYDHDPEFGGARFPPTVCPSPEDEQAVRARWKELGLDGKKRG